MIMTNNRRYSLLILVIFGLGAFFTIVWGIYLDKGTLIIKAKAPFHVDINLGPTMDCAQSECKVELKPNIYQLTITKDNHEEYQSSIEVKRWQEVTFEASLNFIPNIIQLDGAPVVTDNEQEGIQEDDFYLAEDTAQNKQALYQRKSDGSKSVLSYFPRFIQKSKLFVSPNGKNVLVVEEAENNVFYVVDAEKITRKKYFESTEMPTEVSWSPDENKVILNLGSTLKILDLSNQSEKNLPFTTSLKLLAWQDIENVIFASNQPVSYTSAGGSASQGNSQTITFNDYLDIINGTDEVGPVSSEAAMVFYSYNFTNENLKSLISVEPNTISWPEELKITSDAATSKIYFWNKDQVAFELKMSE